MPDPTPNDKPITLDLNDPAVKAALAALVEQETTGLKTNRDTILNEKRQLADQLKQVQEQLAKFGGLDPAKTQAMIAAFQQSEEAKLISEGKLEEVLNRRTEAMRADAEARVKAALAKVDELTAAVSGRDGKISELIIDADIRDAAIKQGVNPHAVVDAVMRARGTFKVSKEYKPEARDASGTLLMGKNGKDPLTPAEWLEQQKAQSPHWWPPSAGGGANGGSAKGKGSGALSEDQLAKMTPAQKMAAALAASSQ